MRLSSYVANACLALAYVAVYIVCYFNFLNYHFGYYGFALYPRQASFMALSVAIAVMPVFCHRGFRALSSALSVFVYVILYIPVILTFALGASAPVREILAVQLTFMGCMCLLFLADVAIVKNPFHLHTRHSLIGWVLALTIASTCLVLFAYRSNLRLVAFAEVYEQRAANADLGAGIVIRYMSAWLYSVMIPLCLAYGLVSRSYRFFWGGVAACVTLYLATAAKSAVVLPVIYLGVYGLFARNRIRALYPIFLGALSTAMCALVVVRDTDSVSFLVSSLVLMRTIGTGGLLTLKYYEFFASHPRTLYTHINIVGMLTHAYPYGSLQPGEAVGQYYFSWDMNANANFWAMDGIAALGLLGVVFVSIVCALVFVAINSVTSGYNKLFVVLCFLPFIVSFLNTSLFSSLWSGGALLLSVFFLLNKRDDSILFAQADQAVL